MYLYLIWARSKKFENGRQSLNSFSMLNFKNEFKITNMIAKIFLIKIFYRRRLFRASRVAFVVAEQDDDEDEVLANGEHVHRWAQCRKQISLQDCQSQPRRAFEPGENHLLGSNLLELAKKFNDFTWELLSNDVIEALGMSRLPYLCHTFMSYVKKQKVWVIKIKFGFKGYIW